MREIKFRAYIYKLERMEKVEQINFDIDNVEVNLSDSGDYWEYGFDEIELMQFTGRRDDSKSKVEIYEGDILEVKSAYHEIEFTGVVKYQNSSFCIVNDGFTGYAWIDYNVKVIGNIYENKELIKQI